MIKNLRSLCPSRFKVSWSPAAPRALSGNRFADMAYNSGKGTSIGNGEYCELVVTQ